MLVFPSCGSTWQSAWFGARKLYVQIVSARFFRRVGPIGRAPVSKTGGVIRLASSSPVPSVMQYWSKSMISGFQPEEAGAVPAYCTGSN